MTTICHVNFGIGFGFGLDGLVAFAMCAAQAGGLKKLRVSRGSYGGFLAA